MKKIISLLLACGMYVTTAMSQITLTPYVDSSAGGLNDNNVNVLDGYLRTLINRSGLESGYGGRFVLAVTVNLLEKSMTNTAPVKVVQKVQINLIKTSVSIGRIIIMILSMHGKTLLVH